MVKIQIEIWGYVLFDYFCIIILQSSAMKKYIFIFVAFMLSADLRAQSSTDGVSDKDYRPFVEDGKEWVVGGMADMTNPAAVLDWLRIYKISGDTIIAGKQCKKWHMKRYDHGTLVKDMALSPIYEEDKKVYFFPEGHTEPLLFFDFGFAPNEPRTIYDINHPDISATVSYGGLQWTEYLTSPQCGHLPAFKLSSLHTMPWIVGVGYMGNPNPTLKPVNINDADKLDVGEGNLLYCTVNSDTLFYGPVYFLLGFDKIEGWSPLPKPYHPFVEDGKEWAVQNYNNFGDSLGSFRYFFEGDTLIGERRCGKLIWSGLDKNGHVNFTHFCAAVYEVGEKVYFYNWKSATPHLLYDFGAQVGEKVVVGEFRNNPDLDEYEREGVITETKIIDNGRRKFRCLKVCFTNWIDPSRPGQEGYWIEGAGAPLGPLANCVFHTTGGESTNTTCMTNEQPLFDSSLLNSTAIRDIPQSPSQPGAQSSFVNRHSSSLYDLQGRRLSAPPAKGMYIQDKRVKILCR